MSCRKELSVKVESLQQEKDGLRAALDAQMARFAELGTELTQRACQGSTSHMFESLFTVDIVLSDCALPARCGHLMLPLSPQESSYQYAICVGGIEGEDWQSSCFGVILGKEDFASSKPHLHTCAVHSNVQDPLRLCESAACVISNDSVLLCGGRNGGEEQSCVWIGRPTVVEVGNESACISREGMSAHMPFFMASTQGPIDWISQSSCGCAVKIAWQEVCDTSALFDARCQHSVSYYAARDCAIIFGGYNVRKKHLSDVWVMDLPTQSLWQASDHGELPKARRGQVAHVIGEYLWVFGGACDSGVLGDVTRLCLSTWAWQKVSIRGTKNSGHGHIPWKPPPPPPQEHINFNVTTDICR